VPGALAFDHFCFPVFGIRRGGYFHGNRLRRAVLNFEIQKILKLF
jgi:hypothetical protein